MPLKSKNTYDRRLPFRTSGPAFTFVELLVVIAIIAILASLILPALSRAKATAHSAACKSKLRQIGITVSLYTSENRSEYPFFDYQIVPSTYWFHFLRPYLQIGWTNPAYHCPSFKAPIRDRGSSPSGLMLVPSGSYSYNAWGTEGGYGTASILSPGSIYASQLGLGGIRRNWIDDVPPISESQVKIPSEMFAISDSRIVDGPHAAYPQMWQWSGFWRETAAAKTPRHGKGYNILFCDGHVGFVKRSDFIAPKTSRNWNRDHEPHPETYHP